MPASSSTLITHFVVTGRQSEEAQALLSFSMGCSSSMSHKRGHISLPLSETQKYLVRETWETVEQHKNNVGKKTFLR